MNNFTSAKTKKRQSPQESNKVRLMANIDPGPFLKLKKHSNPVCMLLWFTGERQRGRESEREGENIIKYII